MFSVIGFPFTLLLLAMCNVAMYSPLSTSLPIVQCKGRVQSSCPDVHWQPGVNLFSICDKCWEHCQELSGPRAWLHTTHVAGDCPLRSLSMQLLLGTIRSSTEGKYRSGKMECDICLTFLQANVMQTTIWERVCK